MAHDSDDTPDWLDELAALASVLGDPRFEDHLMTFLNRVVPVDHCAVFTFAPDGKAGHLFTKSRMSSDRAERLARDYVGGYFSADPNLSMIDKVRSDRPASAVIGPVARPAGYDSAYRSHFFEHNDLVDKASTMVPASGGVVYCNFYRMGDSGAFSKNDWQRLTRFLPLVTGLISAHFRLRAPGARTGRQDQSQDRGSAQSLVHSVINRAAHPFDRLTEREREVTARILLGYTSEAIGLDLGIARTSVATYRKRAYAKLGIATQNELFSLCLTAIERHPGS